MVSLLLGTGTTLHGRPLCALQQSQSCAFQKSPRSLNIHPVAPAAHVPRQGQASCLIISSERSSDPEVAQTALGFI